jgi:hypothetical protein
VLFLKSKEYEMSNKLLIIIYLAVASPTLWAKCSKSNVCDDYGQNCQTVDICSNTLDLPSVNLAPITPLPTLQLKPLPSLQMPPIGTTSCDYMQVNGRWQNVCR